MAMKRAKTESQPVKRVDRYGFVLFVLTDPFILSHSLPHDTLSRRLLSGYPVRRGSHNVLISKIRGIAHLVV